MKLDTYLDIDLFTTEVNESMADINEAMRTQTARAAFYGICHSKAKRQRDKVGLIVKSVNAKLVQKHRKELQAAALKLAEEDGTKPEKVTVDMVQAAVALDKDMLTWLGIQLEADEIESINRVAMEAFRMRSSMIQSLGNLTRDQMRTGIQIQSAKDAAAGYRARRDARQAQPAHHSAGGDDQG